MDALRRGRGRSHRADYESGAAGTEHEHEHLFSRPEDEIATIGVTENGWEVEIAEIRTRQATGPDGESGVLDDTVVLLRRR